MGDVDKQRLKWETINEDQQVWDALDEQRKWVSHLYHFLIVVYWCVISKLILHPDVEHLID
jgi:hypothetical protein